MRSGIEFVYNFEFDSAAASFTNLREKYPEHPAGNFMHSMVLYWRITAYPETTVWDDDFLASVDSTLKVCNALLHKNPVDLTGLFFKGGILGYRGRFLVKRKQFVDAAADGKTALDIVMKCKKMAPSNPDIMLGSGVYMYFADVIPETHPMLKPVMWFMPPGDRERGLLELHHAADYARYAAVEAQVTLLQVYYQFEENYKMAQSTARKLLDSFPMNPYFHRYYARCLVRRGFWTEMEQEWRSALLRCMERKTGYDNTTAREAMYYIGLALKRKSEYKTAVRYFVKCEEFSQRLDRDEPTGFRILAMLRRAECLFELKQYEASLEAVELVLDWDEYQDSHDKAEALEEQLESLLE